MNFYVSCIIGLLSFLSCNNEVWNLKPIPDKFNFYDKTRAPSGLHTPLDELLLSHLTVDQITSILQHFIEVNDTVIFPDCEIIVGELGLSISSNKTIVFQQNSILRMTPNTLETNAVINISRSKNISIQNANLIGDRYDHSGDKGEWGMGIFILGGENILIENFKIEQFWGDGIYIGRKEEAVSKNVKVKNGVLNNNRRDGISITSIDGLYMSQVSAINSNGTNPQFGFAIEPNSNKDRINNIKIDSIFSFNNVKGGFKASLDKIGGKEDKEINIEVNYFEDIGSYRGLYINRLTDKSRNVSGKIVLHHVYLSTNDEPIILKYFTPENFFVQIDELTIANPVNPNMNKSEVLRVHKFNRNVILDTEGDGK